MPDILVLHGPNLNMLGTREPSIYGSENLDDINTRLKTSAEKHAFSLEHFQSNAEHLLIDQIHQAKLSGIQFIIINPAAFTHSSIAIRDALLSVDIPFIEVHLSNVHRRETFRHHSYFSDIALGVICGLGSAGYDFALTKAIEILKS